MKTEVKAGVKVGMKTKMRTLRILAGLLVLVVALVGFQFDTAIGTLCLLCPVGFLQIAAASGSIPWALLPGVVIVLLIVFALGRVFCSWLCPTSLLKNVFGGHTPRGLVGRSGEECEVFEKGCRAPRGGKEETVAESTARVAVASKLGGDKAAESESSDGKSSEARPLPETEQASAAIRPASCASCSSKHDTKTQALILGVLLVVSFIVKFPVFCLICPIGLVFGTLWAVNRVFVLLQPGWELIIFPLMLIAEIFLFKRWCSAICPLGFFFTLMAKARTKLKIGIKPNVTCSTCISQKGCTTCSTVCGENIDVASADLKDIEACTMCLDCVENCPTKSITAKGKR